MLHPKVLYRTALMVVILLGLGLFSLSQAQTPVFRIGVLDEPSGSLSRGAQLAVREINARGGVVGADGTVFRLELVIESPTNLSRAINNINQARVIAVVGPETSIQALGNLSALQALNVPILTTATDDTITARDTTGLIFRLRAPESVQGRALATYLVNELNANRIVSVQLDLESTVSVIGFSTALSSLGGTLQETFLLDQRNQLGDIARNIRQVSANYAVIYGAPELVATLYNELRSASWSGTFVYNRADHPSFLNALSQPPTNILSFGTWSFTENDSLTQDFLSAYVGTFGQIPDALSAATYDGMSMIANAIGRPGDLRSNLAAISNFAGVQGTLNPSGLARGETSLNVSITELNEFGVPQTLIHYLSGTPFSRDVVSVLPTPTPSGTNINPGGALPTPTPFIIATATPQGVIATITRTVQNVRTGPSTVYDILGQLQNGEQVQVIGANVDLSWVVINFRGQQGWLSRDILDLAGNLNTVPFVASPPTPTPPPATPTTDPIPDLVILSAAPTRLTIGQPFTVTVTVFNQGSVGAGPFAIAATFEPGSVFSAVNLGGLAAGQSIAVNLTGTLSGTSGSQNVTIVADLNNQVNEGTFGEANNSYFILTYMADNSVLTPGGLAQITLAPGNAISLDAGGTDIQWTGSELIAQNGAQIYLMAGFTNIDQVHYSLISTTTNASPIQSAFLQGAYVGLITDQGKRGVIRIDSLIINGNLTLAYRIYN